MAIELLIPINPVVYNNTTLSQMPVTEEKPEEEKPVEAVEKEAEKPKEDEPMEPANVADVAVEV